MKSWIFRDFISERGVNEIREWIDSLPMKAQIKIDRRISYLQATRTFDPQYISARDGCDDIYELRVVCAGVQYRPLGCYGPERGEFTLLVGAVEKGSRLEPKDAPEIATHRRKIVMADKRRTREHE
ncbi:MAG: type II toxin-antitoxin system RelE/ParE family toxin [Thermoanaerobaculia bacterium]